MQKRHFWLFRQGKRNGASRVFGAPFFLLRAEEKSAPKDAQKFVFWKAFCLPFFMQKHLLQHPQKARRKRLFSPLFIWIRFFKKWRKPLHRISCVSIAAFGQNHTRQRAFFPFFILFLRGVLYLDKASLCTMTIFLSSYLKKQKTVAFCNLRCYNIIVIYL